MTLNTSSGNMGLEVIVGTYEQLLLGYKLGKENNDFKLENSFTDHSHVGIVRCLDISSKGFLASGSSDEVIKLFNLKTRRELGTLMHHEGSINQIRFHDENTMVTCSDDCTLGIWRVGHWECLRTLRGHKGPVYGVSIHNSGKLALSVSRDRTMRTWNLITGKCAYVTKLQNIADFVEWTPPGDKYFIVSNTTADLYNVETAKVEVSLKCGFKIHSIVFIEDNVAAIAGETGVVRFYSIPSGEKVFEFATETNRIKGMRLCSINEVEEKILVTGSADGHIKLWKVKPESETWSTSLLTSVDTKFRIISMAVNTISAAKQSAAEATNEEESESVEASSDDEEMDSEDEEDDEEEEEEEEGGKKEAEEGEEESGSEQEDKIHKKTKKSVSIKEDSTKQSLQSTNKGNKDIQSTSKPSVIVMTSEEFDKDKSLSAAQRNRLKQRLYRKARKDQARQRRAQRSEENEPSPKARQRRAQRNEENEPSPKVGKRKQDSAVTTKEQKSTKTKRKRARKR